MLKGLRTYISGALLIIYTLLRLYYHDESITTAISVILGTGVGVFLRAGVADFKNEVDKVLIEVRFAQKYIDSNKATIDKITALVSQVSPVAGIDVKKAVAAVDSVK
jgi:hypothetical protein